MRTKLITIGMLALVLVSSGYSFYVKRQMDKIIVIDVIRVFNEYNLKKDLEARVEGTLKQYSGSIDSLKVMLEKAKGQEDSLRFIQISKAIYQVQQQAQQSYEASNQNINEQVWKRLNPLIDEFGEKNDLHVIIGANGMGSVLYNDAAIDKTTELIKFINSKYERGS